MMYDTQLNVTCAYIVTECKENYGVEDDEYKHTHILGLMRNRICILFFSTMIYYVTIKEYVRPHSDSMLCYK